MASAAAASNSHPQLWAVMKTIKAPDGRVVPVDNVVFHFDQDEMRCFDVRNRVIAEWKQTTTQQVSSSDGVQTVEKTSASTRVVLQYYAAVETLVNYQEYGYVLTGHIWHNPKSSSQVNEVERIKNTIAAQIGSARKTNCTIL